MQGDGSGVDRAGRGRPHPNPLPEGEGIWNGRPHPDPLPEGEGIGNGDIDIELGAPGDPLGPVRQALERRGLRLSKSVIADLRSGRRNPARTAQRLACADRLHANDATAKTDCCLRALAAGRQSRQGSDPPRVYATVGLTRGMRAALGWTYQELSYVLRTMRADLAVWSTHLRNDELDEQFREGADLFLRVHRDRNWKVYRSPTDAVRAAWDLRTIPGFYFALYATAGSMTRAAWLPYELDLLWSFYLRQRELGDPLTPLDRQVLRGAVTSDPTTSRLRRMVRAHVGVDYDERCVAAHCNLLATGSPKPVWRPRRAPAPGPGTRDRLEQEGSSAGEHSAATRTSEGARRAPRPRRTALSYLPPEVAAAVIEQVRRVRTERGPGSK